MIHRTHVRKLLLTFSIVFCMHSTLLAQLKPVDTAWVEQTLKTLSLEEKLGQLFIPVHRNLEKTKEIVAKGYVGGLWFARAEAHAIARELNILQEASKVPLLITVDFEKGAGSLIDGATDLPNNMALGAANDPELVRKAAMLTAQEARALGIHLNFAPALDVNNNPRNPIINTRSFGENPERVAELGVAAVEGYQSAGLLATGKHFPGHGNTGTDSHASLGTVESSGEVFENTELLPFREVIRRTGVSSIMSAHLWVKAIDTDTVPATLSHRVMTGLLRERLGFKGLVLTDALEMGGITKRYAYEDALVKAIQAGCDILLFAQDPERGINALKQAIARGDIPVERIDQSVRRILSVKSQAGLNKGKSTDETKIASQLGTPEQYALAREIASRCLTLVRDDRNLVPLKSSQKTVVITMTNKTGTSMMARDMTNFPDEVRKIAPDAKVVKLTPAMNADEVNAALAEVRQAEMVVVAAYVKIVLSSGTVELPPAHKAFIDTLAQCNPNTVLLSFGNPYIIGSLKSVPTYVCAYDNCQAMQQAAAEALYGLKHFSGTLPVSLTEMIKAGTGLKK